MKFRTLIVDSDRVFRTQCARVLRSNNDREFYVTQAANGQEALEVVNRQSFELVLVSGKLPDMFGSELIKELRLGVLQSAPIILLADGDSRTVKEDARLCGASSCLPKHISTRKLLQTLNELLQKTDGHPSLFHSEQVAELNNILA
ncbi:MAG: PleD family two-component system response regulator [Gammaproteobacteria bacterium]